MTTDANADAQGAYEDALDRSNRLKNAWKELGYPVLTTGSTGQDVPHPLLKAIHEAEVIADRLRERIRKKHAGPEPSAVVTSLNKPRITKKAS